MAGGGGRGEHDDVGDVAIERGIEPLKRSFKNQIDIQDDGTVILAAARDEAFELDSLKHGIFTHALIRALTTREADVNPADGALSVDELRTFLASTVKSVSLRDVHQEQEVTDFTQGSTLNWVVADNLPAGSLQEAQVKVAAIHEMLTRWSAWMTPETKNVCWQSTDNWLDSVRNGTTLSATDQAVFKFVEAALVNAVGTDQVRGEMLHQNILPFTRR